MTKETRTTTNAIEQITSAATLEPRAWIASFIKHADIKDAADIQAAVRGALSLGARLPPAERLRTPRETAMYGGDHEDCAAFAIAIAYELRLSYELRILNNQTLQLSVNGVRILPF